MSDTTTALDRAELVAVIGRALTAVLGDGLPELTEESRLFDQVGLDSSGVFELLMELEEALDIELDTDHLEMSHFESLRSLADFLITEMSA
ncbi:phosphopantetheine-binding protein [Kitasatospora sp. NPDC054795]